MSKDIPSILTTRATAALDKEILAELEVPDPTPERAKAILNDNDRTKSTGESK